MSLEDPHPSPRTWIFTKTLRLTRGDSCYDREVEIIFFWGSSRVLWYIPRPKAGFGRKTRVQPDERQFPWPATTIVKTQMAHSDLFSGDGWRSDLFRGMEDPTLWG